MVEQEKHNSRKTGKRVIQISAIFFLLVTQFILSYFFTVFEEMKADHPLVILSHSIPNIDFFAFVSLKILMVINLSLVIYFFSWNINYSWKTLAVLFMIVFFQAILKGIWNNIDSAIYTHVMGFLNIITNIGILLILLPGYFLFKYFK